jgi:hypothetical protein
MNQAFQKEHWCSAENVPAVMVRVWPPGRSDISWPLV